MPKYSGFDLTNKKASAVLCSVVKHAGSGRARKKCRGKHETQSGILTQKDIFLFSSKYDTLGLEERYGRCFKGQFFFVFVPATCFLKATREMVMVTMTTRCSIFQFCANCDP